MKRGVRRVIRLCAWVVIASLSTAVLALEAAWRLPERLVPPPAGASSNLQQAIASTPQPDVRAARSRVPASPAEWEALIAERASRRPSLAALAETFGVTVERGVVDGVRVHRVRPPEVAKGFEDAVFIYVHGGAYVFGGGDAAPAEGARIAGTAGINVLSVDYRMPPDHPFPAAVDDVVSVYRYLLATHAPGAVAMGGTSAGGGLTLASVHRMKALGLPVPGALYAGTPWADLTDSGDTIHTNEGLDRVLVTYDGLLKACAELYADGQPLTNPLLSPVYGDFAGFPPTILITGTRDLFLSDTARTHRKLRAAGVDADLHVFEALSHAGYIFLDGAPEQTEAYAELARFLHHHLRQTR